MLRIATSLLLLSVFLHVQAEPSLNQHLQRQVTIAAGKVEEPCLPMMLSDRMEFEFKASDKLDFNLHYYNQNSVFFPVQLKGVRDEQGEYFAPGSRQYCMMWTNRGDAPVSLQYQYKVYRNQEAP